ncbi:MAG: TonB-dependent receptor [Pseudomonadota bacterium]|jgi:Outer membrane receptor proteins, mostly Fe transport|nr:MAG: TonB-dependent receptor [Pseudomonadota bacterium]
MKASDVLSTSAVILGLLHAAPVIAQEAPGERTEDQEVVTLGEIVVTAQRVEENVQRTPVAVAVIDPDALIRSGVSRPDQLTNLVPAFVGQEAGGPYQTYFVRGVGNFTANPYSDPAIAFNADGVYIGRPSSSSGFFYDLSRVEVLKGPQGTLYGRNATGGAVNVIPARPVLGENSAELVAGFGNFSAIEAQGAVNVALGDRSALRFAANIMQHDGYLSDGTAEQDDWGARLQYLVEPTDSLSIRLAADYSEQNGAGPGAYLVGTFAFAGPAGYVLTPAPGVTDKIGLHSPQTDAVLSSVFNSQAGRVLEPLGTFPFNDNQYWGVLAELEWSTDAGTLTVLPAYREAELDFLFTAPAFRGGRTVEQDEQFSIEARWAGKAGDRVDYLVGAYYFDESVEAAAQFAQLVLSPYQTLVTDTESTAVFGKVTFSLTDTLRLTAAGRYTEDKKRFDGVSETHLLFCGNPAPPQDFCPDVPLMPFFETAEELRAFYASNGIPVTPVPLYVLPGFVDGTPFVLNAPIPINSKLDNDKFTYRAALEWDVAPRSLLYLSYETGYRSGGFSFARGLETYLPEEIKATTLGSKNRFFDNRLQLNVELFRWKYTDQQYSQFGYDRGNPPATVFVTRNIGNSTNQGIDIEMQWLATPNTLIGTTLQYLDAEYDSFVYLTPNQGLPPNTACAFSPTTENGLNEWRVDCSGREAFNAPEWSFNASIQQTIPLGDNRIVLQASTRFRDDMWVAPDYQPWALSKSDWQSNLAVTFDHADGNWFVTGFVNNIEDNRRITYISTTPSVSAVTAMFSAPRTYGLRVGFRF